MIHLVKSKTVAPGCLLPQNFSGDWINTANMGADVFINKTHLIEIWRPDDIRFKQTIYVCREQRGSRYMMARLTVDGWYETLRFRCSARYFMFCCHLKYSQMDYVCYDFLPLHHNIIRYRRSKAFIQNDFDVVCSTQRFPKKNWKYDVIVCEYSFWKSIATFSFCVKSKIVHYFHPFSAKNPLPVKCPVAGKFNFTQQGDVMFENRIFGGVALSPRPQIACKNIISDISVCDPYQKEITIDVIYCLDVNYRAQPVDIYSDPDYRLQCVGYWKENSKSYLITYDPNDPGGIYRCWVYRLADINRVLMSQAMGSFCDFKQDAWSSNYTHGATVAVDMIENERERQ